MIAFLKNKSIIFQKEKHQTNLHKLVWRSSDYLIFMTDRPVINIGLAYHSILPTVQIRSLYLLSPLHTAQFS